MGCGESPPVVVVVNGDETFLRYRYRKEGIIVGSGAEGGRRSTPGVTHMEIANL